MKRPPAQEPLPLLPKLLILLTTFSLLGVGGFFLTNWSVQPVRSQPLPNTHTTHTFETESGQVAMAYAAQPSFKVERPSIWDFQPEGIQKVSTGLGTPTMSVRWRMAQLAYQAHLDKKRTPQGLGSNGCAAAAWTHVIRPALIAAYPNAASKIPYSLTHTQQIIAFYQRYNMGKLSRVPAFALSPAKTPPGTVIIGIKKGNNDEHMLIAVEVDWGSVLNPATGEYVTAELDGVTDAYAGNTGLVQYGSPHFRIQEFASNLGFLNTHHGAINSLSENNYYDHFLVFTFER